MNEQSAARPARQPASRRARAAVAAVGAGLAALFVAALGPAFRVRLAALGPEAREGLTALGLGSEGYVATGLVLHTLLAAEYFAVGAFLLWIVRANRFAVYSAAVLFGIGALATQVLGALGEEFTGVDRLLGAVDSFSFLAFLLWVLTFPDGVLRTRASRITAVAAGIFAAATAMGLTRGLGPAAMVAAMVLLLAVAAIFLIQARRRPPRRQRHLAWTFLFVVGTLAAASLAQAFLGAVPGTAADVVVQLVLVAAFAAIPVSIAAAVLRGGLWDAGGAVARSLTLSLVTIGAVATYLLLAVGAAVVRMDTVAASAVALVLVAVAVHPAHARVLHRVNRALYGERDDPRAILGQLTAQLSAAAEPGTFVQAATDGVVRILRVPFARIEPAGPVPIMPVPGLPKVEEESAARWPASDFALVHKNVPVGTLVIAHRDLESTFGPHDRLAIDSIVPHVAALLHAMGVDEQLREAHRNLVSTREEERRRLRNDLHDGLGPSLGAVVMGLSAAENLVFTDPDAARALLVDARGQLRDSVGEVRRLVHGLRPPALDERGLLAAVQSFVRGVDQGAMRVMVDAGHPLPPLAAAVEVAAYFIVLEAISNAIRHSGGSLCSVRLRVLGGAADAGETLEILVRDDGRGLAGTVPRGLPAGIGLTSMRARAAAVGGTFEVGSSEADGSLVMARLPVDGTAGMSGRGGGEHGS